MLGHLISFYPYPETGISFWKKDEVGELGLHGKKLSMRFSDSVLCIGYQELEKHVKCPHNLKGWKQCNYCRFKDISRVFTRLDFKGYEELREEYVHQDFSLYLAAFGDSIIKCGVTRSERVGTRTLEQGADFWVELMRFDNGEDAYRVETELQQRFNLRNSVRNDAKLALLNKPKSPEALEAKIKEIKEKNYLENNLCESVIVRENAYPVPESFDVALSIDGTITGSKSQLLFYEKDGNHFVVPMYRMAGRVFLLKE